MKKLLLSSILAIFMVAVSGCESAEIYPHDYIGVYDTKTRQQIEIGMSKEDVEKILGRAENEEEAEDESKIGYGYYDYVDYTYDEDGESYENSITIKYNDDNEIERIRILNHYDDNTTRYELPGGINCESIVTDFTDLYTNIYEYPLPLVHEHGAIIFIQKVGDKCTIMDKDEISKIQKKLEDNPEDEKLNNIDLYAMSIEYDTYDDIFYLTVESNLYYLEEFDADGLSEAK